VKARQALVPVFAIRNGIVYEPSPTTGRDALAHRLTVHPDPKFFLASSV